MWSEIDATSIVNAARALIVRLLLLDQQQANSNDAKAEKPPTPLATSKANNNNAGAALTPVLAKLNAYLAADKRAARTDATECPYGGKNDESKCEKFGAQFAYVKSLLEMLDILKVEVAKPLSLVKATTRLRRSHIC